MTAEKEFQQLYYRMAQLCEENNWGDPFSYARAKEILAASVLGHKVASTYAGADAFLPDGTPVEYKSTIGGKNKGSYTGISVQPTWEQQEKYLKEEKIAKYPEHYFNRFDKEKGFLVEVWKLKGEDVYNILLPKLKEKFATVLNKKDPRLSANVTNTEIKNYGTRVI